jgi:hypothetical protein
MESTDSATGDSSHSAAMRAVGPRRFNLGDAMIFTAATSFALPFALWAFERIREWNGVYPIGFDRGIRVAAWTLWWGFKNRSGQGYHAVNFATQGGLVFLATWSLALVAARIRRPRPPIGEASLQPGSVVRLVVLLNLWAYLFLAWFQVVPPPRVQVSTWGGGVAAAWGLLAITGRWKPEASWLDRFGRALGVCWIPSTPLLWWLGQF